jgi:ABC-type amino acid transport substrate-binding protein
MSNGLRSADDIGESGVRQARALVPVMRSRLISLAGLAAAVLVANCFPDCARGATTTSDTQPPLRVVAVATAPFVLPRTDSPAGFSVDLWNELARRMHVDFTWHAVRDPAEVLAAVQSHDADVAIGAIPVTPESDQLVDFSVPYFDSGLRIMVRAQYEAGVISILRSIPWVAIGHLFAVAMVIIFLLANAAKQGKGVVQVVGPIFRPQKYAFAVAVGSALRKQINRALLEIYADGTYERIYSAWFSAAP